MADNSLALKRRKKLSKTITLVARLLGSAASELPGRPELLTKIVLDSGILSNRSNKFRWEKLRPTLRVAVERCGLSKVPGQYGHPLSEAWQELADAILVKSDRYLLSRFMRFQSVKGLRPCDVDQKALQAYHCALLSECLVPQPNSDCRRTCRIWNKVVAEVLRWPKAQLVVPSFTKASSLPLSRLPKRLAVEMERYLTSRAIDDPLDRHGASGLRTASVVAIRSTLRQHASLLLRSGWMRPDIDSLAKLTSVSAVKCSASYLSKGKAGRSPRLAAQIASVAASIARHWTIVPDGMQRELDELRQALNRRRSRLSSINLQLAVQFDSEATCRALLCLPRHLLKVASALPKQERAALLAQTALAIEILINAPLKASQLAMLCVSDHFRKRGDGRLVVSVVENRNLQSRPRDVVLTRECGRIFDIYVRQYRHMLTGNEGGPLFPGYGNRSKCGTVMGRQIKDIAAEFCDLDLRPSAFRAFAAKHYLMYNPGDYCVLAAVLGNSSIASTERTYASLNAPSAARTVDLFVAGPSKPEAARQTPTCRKGERRAQAK